MIKKTPRSLYLLILLLAIQSLGGIWGGFSLALSPSGHLMKIPVSMLSGSPFRNFLIPGLILLLFLGFLPGFLAFALFRLPDWKWGGFLNIYHGIHWAWTYSLYLGIMLITWILVEIIWIDYDILQTLFGLVGVAILIAALLPQNMRYAGWFKE